MEQLEEQDFLSATGAPLEQLEAQDFLLATAAPLDLQQPESLAATGDLEQALLQDLLATVAALSQLEAQDFLSATGVFEQLDSQDPALTGLSMPRSVCSSSNSCLSAAKSSLTRSSLVFKSPIVSWVEVFVSAYAVDKQPTANNSAISLAKRMWLILLGQ